MYTTRQHVEAVHKHHRRRGYKLILVGSKVDSVSEYGRADVEGVVEVLDGHMAATSSSFYF